MTQAIWLTGPRGQQYNLLYPQPGIFTPEDAASILGQKARWLGQLPKFKSVAEHCYVVGHETGLAGHVHDLGEVVTGDIPTPLKRVLATLAEMAGWARQQAWHSLLPDSFKEALLILACFTDLEDRWRDAILQGWGLPPWRELLEYIDNEDDIRSKDKSHARYELELLTGEEEPAVDWWAPEQAAREWLKGLVVWRATFEKNKPSVKASRMMTEDERVWTDASRVKNEKEAEALFRNTYDAEYWHEEVEWGWVFGEIESKRNEIWRQQHLQKER